MGGLGAGDLGAAETAGAHDLDAPDAGPHGAADGVLHGPPEADALLQLLGDVLRHQLGAGIGALDFHDAQAHGLAQHLLHGETELLDLRAAAADDDAGSGAVDINADPGAVPLDLDGGNAGGIEGLLQELADLVILNDQIPDTLLAGIPAGIPVFDDADAQSMGINFLSHTLTPSPSQRR